MSIRFQYKEVITVSFPTTSSSRLGYFEEDANTAVYVPLLFDAYKIIPTIIDGVTLQSLTLGEKEKGTVRLYSIFGELIRTWKVESGKNFLDMNALGMAKGVYVYVVEVEGVVKRKDKLVKLN